MRIALWDIAGPQKDRLARHLPSSDVFVDIPAAPAAPVTVDVVVASRFGAQDNRRANFRLLQVAGAGTDKIDFAALPPEAYACNAYEHEGPIAEYIMTAILDHTTGFTALTRRMPELGWTKAYMTRQAHGEVAGKTIGLVGFGHIGQAVAKRARAFGMTVMAVTGGRHAALPEADWFATVDQLGELLQRSDYVVLACPLTERTRGLIGNAELHHMKRSALLVNVARAEVAVEEDLFEGLKSGVIAGAVLDPWYRYPTSPTDIVEPSRFPFGSLPNVRMTPHAAGWTSEVWDRRVAFFARNIERLRAGEPLLNIVHTPSALRASA